MIQDIDRKNKTKRKHTVVKHTKNSNKALSDIQENLSIKRFLKT